MKNIIISILLVLISSVSYASRARTQALNSSFHITDSQHLYTSLLDINYLDNFVTYESGTSTPVGANDGAEGLALYKINPQVTVAMGFGHQQAQVLDARLFMNTVAGSTYKLQQNPLNFVFGFEDAMTSYAFGMYYSHNRDVLNAQGEDSAGLSYGVEFGKLQIYGELGLINGVDAAATQRFQSDQALSLNLVYGMDSTSVKFSGSVMDVKSLTGTVENESHIIQKFSVSLEDSRAKDDTDTFWGVQVLTTKIDCHIRASAVCNESATSIKMPLWFGLEVPADDWLVVRGSIVQSFLISQSKDSVGYPAGVIDSSNGAVSEYGNAVNDTAVNLGAGLKFNKFIVDAVLSTASTQVLNSTNLLSQVSVTYNY